MECARCGGARRPGAGTRAHTRPGKPQAATARPARRALTGPPEQRRPGGRGWGRGLLPAGTASAGRGRGSDGRRQCEHSQDSGRPTLESSLSSHCCPCCVATALKSMLSQVRLKCPPGPQAEGSPETTTGRRAPAAALFSLWTQLAHLKHAKFCHGRAQDKLHSSTLRCVLPSVS